MTLPKFRTRTFSEVRALAATEPAGWLAEGLPLIPRSGIVLVVGDPLAGKSTLCVALAVAMAADGDFAGHPVAQGRTVWVAAEHTVAGLVDKFERACRADRTKLGALDGKIDFAAEPHWTLDAEDDVDSLAEMLDQQGVDMVVLDCFRRVSSADENSSQAVADALRQARRLSQDKAGAARRLVVLIHHLGKKGTARGSSDFTAGVDSVVIVQRDGAGWKLKAQHHTAPEFSCRVGVEHRATSTVITDCQLPSTPPGVLDDAVVRALRAGPAQTKPGVRRAVRATGIKAKNEKIDACLDALVATGGATSEPGPNGSTLYRGTDPQE